MELVVLIGLQAAGKSWFRRARFEATHVVVSKDDLRNNRQPTRRQDLLIRQALGEGKPVVVDNTNVRREDRVSLVSLAREFGVPVVGYWLRSTLADSLRRNALRDGRARIPDVGVRATLRAFVEPGWAEGFDLLYEVQADFEGNFAARELSREEAPGDEE